MVLFSISKYCFIKDFCIALKNTAVKSVCLSLGTKIPLIYYGVQSISTFFSYFPFHINNQILLHKFYHATLIIFNTGDDGETNKKQGENNEYMSHLVSYLVDQENPTYTMIWCILQELWVLLGGCLTLKNQLVVFTGDDGVGFREFIAVFLHLPSL